MGDNNFPTEFIPVSQVLVKECGYQAAYIWGVVWSYCQMEEGICKASHDKIADRAGMSRRSVITHISELIKAGYIEDLTPGVRNEPHKLSVEIGVQKLHTYEPERCEEIAHQNGVGMQDLHSGYAKTAHLGVQNLHKNRYIEEISIIDDSSNEVGKKPTPKNKSTPSEKQAENRAMFGALTKVCKIDIDLATDKIKGQFNQAGKLMREKNYKPEDILEFEEWWYVNDWRGKQGQAPTLQNIREEWGKFKSSKIKPKAGATAK